MLEAPKCPPPPAARKTTKRKAIPKAALIKGPNGIPLPPPGTKKLPPLPSFDEMLRKAKTLGAAPARPPSTKPATGALANKAATFAPN